MKWYQFGFGWHDQTGLHENHYFVSSLSKPKPTHTLVICKVRSAKQCCGSATFDADPETDLTFHYERSYPKFYTSWDIRIFLLVSQQSQSTLLSFSYRRHRCHHLQYFGQYIENFWNKMQFSFTFRLNSYPDRLTLDVYPVKWCRPDQIRIHNSKTAAKFHEWSLGTSDFDAQMSDGTMNSFKTEKVKNGRNRSKFRKTVFYKQILDFHCPSKILCHTPKLWNFVKITGP